MTGTEPDRDRWADVDFEHTKTAERNRLVKARRIADWCWQRGIPPADVTAWPQKTRNRVSREVGVNVSNRLSPTWPLVASLLASMQVWAHAHPWDDRSWQRHTHQRPTWTRNHHAEEP